MSQLRKWIVSLAETSAAAAFSYEWLDQPIALFFHKTVARPGAFAKPTHSTCLCTASRDRHRCPWDCEPGPPSFLHDGVYGSNFFLATARHLFHQDKSGDLRCCDRPINLLSDVARAVRACGLCRCHRPRGCQLLFLERRDCRRLRRHLKRLGAQLPLEGG